MNEPTWVTEDGRKIPLSKLTNSHLLNIFRYLDREITEFDSAMKMYLDPLWGPRGEMAQELAEMEMERGYERRSWLSLWIHVIEEEITRRQLPVPARSKPESPPKVTDIETLTVEGRSSGTIARIVREEEA